MNSKQDEKKRDELELAEVDPPTPPTAEPGTVEEFLARIMAAVKRDDLAELIIVNGSPGVELSAVVTADGVPTHVEELPLEVGSFILLGIGERPSKLFNNVINEL